MSVTDAADGERRQVLPVYGAGFVTAFGAHAVAANLGAYALGHHDSLLELGLILGVYDAAEVVLKPVFGAVVDRRGAKKVMVGGLVAFGLASAAFAVGGHPHLLGAARLAQGAAAAAFSPAAGAAVATLRGKKRTGRLFGGYGGAKGIGYLLGPVAGGALVVAGGYRLLFAVLGAVALVAALAVARLVPDMAPVRRPRSGLGQLVSRISRISQPSFLQPVLLLGAGTAALSAGVGFLPVLGYRHHIDPVATGAIVSLLAATAALLQPWAGRRLDKGRLHPAFAAGGFLACAGGFSLVVGELDHLPEGTRLIVRREPLHAGAQRSLFASFEFRYWGFLTDQEGDPRDLDVTMRAHAHVESHIQRLKDSGLCRFPFTDFGANATWMATVMMAADLVRWFQLLCLEGPWRKARPKALRWSIFHAPARLVHRARRTIVRIVEGWPTADVLLGAYERIAAMT